MKKKTFLKYKDNIQIIRLITFLAAFQTVVMHHTVQIYDRPPVTLSLSCYVCEKDNV